MLSNSVAFALEGCVCSLSMATYMYLSASRFCVYDLTNCAKLQD